MPLDFSIFLEDIAPDHSFDVIFILFPDPWPKRKHWKNRLVQKAFPQKMEKLLRKNGRVYISTDYGPYARRILKIMRDAPQFKSAYPAPHFLREREASIPSTHFESRYLNKNVRPYYQSWILDK